jgi:hypothetical protein
MFQRNSDMFTQIFQKYETLVHTPSDIHQHLPTLHMLAQDCEFVIECGVRGIISSWAFVTGLLKNGKERKQLLLNDLNECNVTELLVMTAQVPPLVINTQWVNDLELDLTGFPDRPDMVFIDTWHVYAQLKRELHKFAPITEKYLVLHDTTVDGVDGETIRNGWNAEEQSEKTGFPVEEIRRGLWPAVEEFLSAHPEWKLKARYINNNGLTVLERVYHK